MGNLILAVGWTLVSWVSYGRYAEHVFKAMDKLSKKKK